MRDSLVPPIRRAAAEAAVIVFFVALAVIATRPLAADLTGATLAGPDPLIDLWTLYWLTSHVLDPSQLFGGNVFAPYPGAVLHSDLSLGTAVLMLPLRPFVGDAVPLYNLAVLVALAFGGWAFHLLGRALTGRTWAGLLCGVLAAFTSHQLFHVYHLNLLSIGWLALFVLGLHRLLERPGVGAVLLTAVSFALSALSSGYYAVAAAIVALLFAAWHARRWRRRSLGAALAAALVAAALVAPYAQAFTALRGETRLRRPQGMSVRMAFQPARDLGSHGLVGRHLVGDGGERLFPGVVTLALAALALVRRRPHAGFVAASAVLLLLVSLGPRVDVFGATLSLPYAWLFAVPPLDAMRHPFTFAAVAVGLLAVLAALGAAALPERRWLAPLLLALAVVETLGPPVAVRPVPPGVPPAYEHVRRLPPGIVLELPVAADEAMVWATRHGLRVANGIGAFSPSQTLRLGHLVGRDWIERAPEDVDGALATHVMRDILGVRYVIVPAERRAEYARLAEAFERSRSFVPLASFPDGTRLYELRASGAEAPAAPRE